MAKIHSKEFSDLYISPNIFRVIKPRRQNWEGLVHYWGEEGIAQGLVGNSNGRRSLGSL